MEKEWRCVKGFEDYYLVSNCGNVYSTRSKKILKPKNSNGYERVCLCADGIRKYCSVHRLVADAFIPNPNNKPTVNHINEIKNDNRVANLEWATALEQNTHGTRIQRAKEHTNYNARKIDYSIVSSKHDYRSMGDKFSKKVNQLTQSGEIVNTFKSLRQASYETGVNVSQICCCLKKRRKTAGGYIWQYAI